MSAARRNVELKAVDPDPARTLSAVVGLGAEDRGVSAQRDTYFGVASVGWRLKLREQEPGGAELITYARADAAGARESRYRVVGVAEPDALRAALDGALGTLVTVEKVRRLLLWEGVRIHLDHVRGLGRFLELEGVAAEGTADLGGERARVAGLAAALGLGPERLVAGSYADLVRGGTGAAHAGGADDAAAGPGVASGAGAAAVLAERAPGFTPRAGLILGSGLAEVAGAVHPVASVPYEALPGFPSAAVAGHRGSLLLGTLGGLPVACLQGRAHVYEGVDPAQLAVPVRALRAAGAGLLVATNAAGSLRPDLAPGRLMLIADHINLLGVNPLTGPNDDAVGPRFPGLRDAYDPELRALLRSAARAAGVEEPAEGVYLATAGPSFETPAEIRAFRTLGADAVGMSTVPEVIAARHCGLRVAAISVLSNLAEGLGEEPLSHAQTLRLAGAAAGDVRRLLTRFCASLA